MDTYFAILNIVFVCFIKAEPLSNLCPNNSSSSKLSMKPFTLELLS